jgi:hypothetical protein
MRGDRFSKVSVKARRARSLSILGAPVGCNRERGDWHLPVPGCVLANLRDQPMAVFAGHANV